MPESETKSRVGRNVGMIALLLGAVAAYGAVALNTLRHGRTTFDEVGYLIRSWWYATGAAEAYTGIDATWQMPLYFYELGWWQRLAGVGHHPGRILSVIAGVLGAAFLFAIVRRLTGNMLAAAAAVLIFIATPATAYAFSMATPAAIVSTLHLAAIWLIVSGLGRPRTWASCALGVLCALIFFTRQNMLLGIVVLIPLYIAAIGRDRWIHGVVVVATAAIVTATILVLFPTPLAAQAMHLPVLTSYLIRWGVLPPDFGLIEQGTTGLGTMAPAFGAVRWEELLDTLVLPFAGVIVSALIVFLVARGPLKVLWIAPLYFLWLIVAHIFASAGYCQGCMIDYTPYFAGAGALAGGLGLAVMASLARKGGVSPVLVICLGAALATALSTFAPILARNQAYRYFPAPQLVQTAGEDEVGDMDLLARWLKATVPAREPILVIHTFPAVPYAAFLAGQVFPVQNIDPAQSRRTIRPTRNPDTREKIQAAVEAQSLWTEDTLKRWLERDYDVVLFQRATDPDQAAVTAALAQNFEVIGTQPFRGQTLTLYKRKAQQ